jgi:uncharacterized protein YutE (UPF0331/DUF86 family)
MVDREVIERRLTELDRNVTNLRRHQGMSVQDLEADLDRQWSVLHGLQLAIQGVLDIGGHLLAAASENRVDTYTDLIDRLGDTGILPAQFARSIRAMAGLRNIIIHQYTEIDLGVVCRVLDDHLDEFSQFAQHVHKHLTGRGYGEIS